MGRKKKETVETEVYCDNRKCQSQTCIRRVRNAPFGVLLHVVRFIPDKKGKCDGLLEG